MPAENVVALTDALSVNPLALTVGAEISGVDPSKPLSLPQRDAVHALQLSFKWTRGTVAFCDNRALLHYPVCNYGDFQRAMKRVLIADDDIPHRVPKQGAV